MFYVKSILWSLEFNDLAILPILLALNFDFGKILQIYRAEICKN